jgi:mannosyltransferase
MLANVHAAPSPQLTGGVPTGTVRKPLVDELERRPFRERHLVDPEALGLVAVIALGAVLRFSTLSLQSFDIDESVTVALLHQGLHATLSTLPTTEKAPPLSYVLAWLWSRPFGLSEAGLRSLSALAGTLTVLLAYDAGKHLISKRAGLITAGLVATSPFLI